MKLFQAYRGLNLFKFIYLNTSDSIEVLLFIVKQFDWRPFCIVLKHFLYRCHEMGLKRLQLLP